MLLQFNLKMQHNLLMLQADLDLGNYERFLDVKLHKDNNITTGKIYQVSCQMQVSAVHQSSTPGL